MQINLAAYNQVRDNHDARYGFGCKLAIPKSDVKGTAELKPLESLLEVFIELKALGRDPAQSASILAEE